MALLGGPPVLDSRVVVILVSGVSGLELLNRWKKGSGFMVWGNAQGNKTPNQTLNSIEDHTALHALRQHLVLRGVDVASRSRLGHVDKCQGRKKVLKRLRTVGV